MLEQLTVQGYALLDKVELELHEGLNVLSGETGAGKSIIIGALSLLFGTKADAGVIRTGEAEAAVSGVFRVAGNPDALAWLASRAIEPDHGAVVIRRVVKAAGRGSLFLQSAPVTAADLHDFSALLVDMHGQHDHQSLFAIDNHRRVLDRFGGFEPDAERLEADFTALTELKKERDAFLAAARELEKDRELLVHAVKEIGEAKLVPGEEEEGEKRARLAANAQQLGVHLEAFRDLLSASRGGALSQLKSGLTELRALASLDSGLGELLSRCETSYFELEDVYQTVRDYNEKLAFDPAEIDEIESRLALLARFKKKYGDDVPAILLYRDEAERKLARLDDREDEKNRIEGDIARLEKSVLQQAALLSQKRKEAGKRLADGVRNVLKDLGMPKASFSVGLEQRKNEAGKPICGPFGIDRIEFLISPNPGEPEKPLRSIASGGELSRVMLAIKSVLAETDQIGTLIFDEIDAGIGGEIAVALGEHLKRLASKKQVVCITHLASIAARADKQIRISKEVRDGRTSTRAEALADSERVEEIARMLAGDREAEVSLAHARELLKKYGS